MAKFRVGVKIYSYNWYLKYNLSYEAMAHLLRSLGVDFVIAQNRYVPMEDSAVRSSVSTEEQVRLLSCDDRLFARALRKEGIEYWVACNVFFDPSSLKRYPEAAPIDHLGRPATKTDWYIGICPSHNDHLQERVAQILAAVNRLEPDGVFLGFMRFPGFWELWLPTTKRSDHPEFCFCDRCVRHFENCKGITIPGKYRDQPWEWIRQEAYAEFVDWKTDLIATIVSKIKQAVRQTGSKARVILNTLPFRPEDFHNAGKEVFGQDWHKLARVVDVFELMTYHQIMARDISWIGQVIHALRESVRKPVISSIQVSPLYIQGMHSGKGRREEITVEEFAQEIDIAKCAGASGIAIFACDDLLHQYFEGSNQQKLEYVRQAGN